MTLTDPASAILASVKVATAENPLTKADEDANKLVLVAATAERLKVWVRPATTAARGAGKVARITAWQERYGGATVKPAEEKPIEEKPIEEVIRK